MSAVWFCHENNNNTIIYWAVYVLKSYPYYLIKLSQYTLRKLQLRQVEELDRDLADGKDRMQTPLWLQGPRSESLTEARFCRKPRIAKEQINCWALVCQTPLTGVIWSEANALSLLWEVKSINWKGVRMKFSVFLHQPNSSSTRAF